MYPPPHRIPLQEGLGRDFFSILLRPRVLQSAWLYETLSPHVDETVVAGVTESRGPKSDKRDAYGLAEKLRVVGNLDKQVFKAPRQFSQLRELSRAHVTVVGDVVRAQRGRSS